MGGRGMSRGRNRGKRGNISIWGSATATEYRGAHYRRQANYPLSFDHPPFASLSPLAGHTREEIALLITWRNVLFGALCNIANRRVRDYSESIDDAKSRPRAAIRDTLRDSFEGPRRENLHFRFCMYIVYLFNPYISLSRSSSRKMSKIENRVRSLTLIIWNKFLEFIPDRKKHKK